MVLSCVVMDNGIYRTPAMVCRKPQYGTLEINLEWPYMCNTTVFKNFKELKPPNFKLARNK